MSAMTHVGEDSPRASAASTSTGSDLGGKSSSRAIRDQAARIIMWTAFGIAVIPLIWILASTILKGGHMLALTAPDQLERVRNALLKAGARSVYHTVLKQEAANA